LASAVSTTDNEQLVYGVETNVPYYVRVFGASATFVPRVLIEPKLSITVGGINSAYELLFEGPDTMLGDVNHDGQVNGLDVDPFVGVLIHGPYDAAADMDQNGQVNGLDVDPFVAAVVGGGALAGAAHLNVAQHDAPVAAAEPDGTTAPVLMPLAVEHPLRVRHAHNSHDDDHDSRGAHESMVDRVFTRRPRVRSRVGRDQRRLRQEEIRRPVQYEGVDDWDVVVDDALAEEMDWIALEAT
jgi:hypothetical protein